MILAIEEWEDIVRVSHKVINHQGINKTMAQISKVGSYVIGAQSHGNPRAYIKAFIGNCQHYKTGKYEKR